MELVEYDTPVLYPLSGAVAIKYEALLSVLLVIVCVPSIGSLTTPKYLLFVTLLLIRIALPMPR